MPGTLEFDVELLRKEKNVERVNHLIKFIKELEEDLECVVCLETGESPLYCCQEQHLVCSTCRPRVRETGQCPYCRVQYPGGDLFRHRLAERNAEKLRGLKEELIQLQLQLSTAQD